MNGAILKERLRGAGVNLSKLAMDLGYKSDQNLHSVLGATDVKSGLIENMAHALNRPISWFYGETSTIEMMSANTNSQVTNLPEGVIDLLRKKDEQIDRLLTIIEKMKI